MRLTSGPRAQQTAGYVLPQSGLFGLEVPAGAEGTHFYIALALVAGFSERWARGVLAGTEERIRGGGGAQADAPAERHRVASPDHGA